MAIRPPTKPPVLALAFFVAACAWLQGCVNSNSPSSLQKPTVSVHSSEWNGHGEYLEDILGKIQTRWYSILNEAHLALPRGSSVDVTFRINSRGETEITKVENKGAGKSGAAVCLDAISYSQPFPKWTGAMSVALGESQSITVTFNYE